MAKYLKKVSKKFFFRKSVISDTIFDFSLTLHTLTIGLNACYIDIKRLFFCHSHLYSCIPCWIDLQDIARKEAGIGLLSKHRINYFVPLHIFHDVRTQ